MKSQIWWYTARAGGIVAWALLTVSVVWGLLLSSRVLGRRISGPKLLDLHRFLGGLAVTFTASTIISVSLVPKPRLMRPTSSPMAIPITTSAARICGATSRR